ncbi:hypothetical protein HPB47_017137 [Ixodes persulcatus]|uniref:Uncharacterized protein n=1 Tax=Ixodes persulcatus TaxID=34615 RepID=A0AC60QP36_IXOPE|nr:hypothetical protein HPB47_017137 [Ixodes persulcatus]
MSDSECSMSSDIDPSDLEFAFDDSPFAFDPPACPRDPDVQISPSWQVRLPHSEAEWCDCGKCQPQLGDEDLCCREVTVMNPLCEYDCIPRHELFWLLCLHREQQRVHVRHISHYSPTYLECADDNRLCLKCHAPHEKVKSGTATEKHGFINCLKKVKGQGLKVASVTTDRHVQVTKYMRIEEPTIRRYFDGWHI